MARKGMRRIGAELLRPLAQLVLVNVQVSAACATETLRSFTSLTASTLNSRLNLRLPVPHLRLYETPIFGVHQTGSSTNWGPFGVVSWCP